MADVHPLTVVDSSVRFGERVKVYQFATICAGTVIGDDCVIGSSVWIGRNCLIRNGVRIQDKAFIVNGAVICSDVFIGPGVVMTDDRHPVAGNKEYNAEPPFICSGASIGAGAVILPGVRIGVRARVGAGAVVTHDVPSDLTVIGLPAKASIQEQINNAVE